MLWGRKSVGNGKQTITLLRVLHHEKISRLPKAEGAKKLCLRREVHVRCAGAKVTRYYSNAPLLHQWRVARRIHTTTKHMHADEGDIVNARDNCEVESLSEEEARRQRFAETRRMRDEETRSQCSSERLPAEVPLHMRQRDLEAKANTNSTKSQQNQTGAEGCQNGKRGQRNVGDVGGTTSSLGRRGNDLEDFGHQRLGAGPNPPVDRRRNHGISSRPPPRMTWPETRRPHHVSGNIISWAGLH